jgi:hypothetical protein
VAAQTELDREYWNPDQESALNSDEMRERQFRALRRRIAALHQHGGYWHRRMTEFGVHENVSSLCTQSLISPRGVLGRRTVREWQWMTVAFAGSARCSAADCPC